MSESASQIAQLNDLLRTTFLTGKVVLTPGIYTLPEGVRELVLSEVREFTGFNEDNDPQGEHDFGSIDVAGVGAVFWKIDYYNPTLDAGSSDPSDPAKTTRVLTVMLALEY